MPPRITQNEFIKRAISIHGSKYDYSGTQYANMTIKVGILCPTHGLFNQLPLNHLRGVGCPTCANESRSLSRQMSLEEFVAKATEIHSGFYGYSKVLYRGHNEKIEIGCPIHGFFWQRANNHLAGIGCNKCGRDEARKTLLKTYTASDGKLHPTDNAPLHKNLRVYLCACGRTAKLPAYTVSRGLIKTCGKCNFVKKEKWLSKTWVCLVLDREQTLPDEWSPFSHQIFKFNCCCGHGTQARMADVTDGHTMSCGCRIPGKGEGSPVREIEDHLGALGVKFLVDDRSVITPFELDIFVPSHNLAIEFNGRYWHSLDGSESPSAKYRHRDKFLACRDKGILLLQIDEHEWENPKTQEIWKSVIASKLGKHNRIHARKTRFERIPKESAEAFLADNHLQGGTPAAASDWCFGLTLGGTLVGMATFSKHEKTLLNLTRMAFLKGTTVVGGARKLFANALSHLPKKGIVTFSNNRYSMGKLYSCLGFSKDGALQPSYQWYFQGKIWNKRSLRRKRLAKLLDGFDPALTEHQNLYRHGARCLYDAGYERWLFENGDG